MAFEFKPNRLKLAREARSKSLNDLAQDIAGTAQQISLWELGKTTPRVDNLVRIANALDTPPSFFFASSDDNSNHQVE